MQNPVFYVIPKPKAKCSVVRTEKLKAGTRVSPMLDTVSTSWPHHHKRFRPYIPCHSKQMPIRFPIPTTFCIVLWGIIWLLFDISRGWSNGFFNMSIWLHSVKPSKDHVPKVPTNFYISFLYRQMNSECHIKNIPCSPEMQISGLGMSIIIR